MMVDDVRCDLCGSDGYRVHYRNPDDLLWLSLYEHPVLNRTGFRLAYVNPTPTFQ